MNVINEFTYTHRQHNILAMIVDWSLIKVFPGP
jgi:hypothetical protein